MVDGRPQAELVRLFADSGGFCVYGHKPCSGYWTENTITVCLWGTPCSSPVGEGQLCRYKPDDPKLPHLPCHLLHPTLIRWHCAYGDLPCYKPFESHYEQYIDILIKEWQASDRHQRQLDWQAERKALHSLGERREPLRGRFNTISKDIYFANQPQFYLEGLGVSGVTLKPFAKVRLASGYLYLYIELELGDKLKGVSKAKRRKALRYGKIADDVRAIIKQAVQHCLDH